MKRLIDLDAAIKDARLNYGGVHDAVLMEHVLKSQQVITMTEKLDRSRWEGCDYCTHNKDNVELCPMLSHDEYDCDRGMYIHRGCLVSNSGEFQYVKIDFCPMCGRPLTEAAWAELERRINGGTNDRET